MYVRLQIVFIGNSLSSDSAVCSSLESGSQFRPASRSADVVAVACLGAKQTCARPSHGKRERLGRADSKDTFSRGKGGAVVHASPARGLAKNTRSRLSGTPQQYSQIPYRVAGDVGA